MANKRIEIKEFKDSGMLQECNRLFFHRLGLALSIQGNETGDYFQLGNILDFREDFIKFDLENKTDEQLILFKQNIDRVQAEFDKIEIKRGYKFQELK